jgi:hypothetical protein
LTTPTPPAAVTVTTDKSSYNVGDPIQVTVEYSDPANPGTMLTVTATVSAPSGDVTGTVAVQVGAIPAQPFPVAVTDSFGATYTQQSSDPGTAVFTGTIAPVPAGT